MRIIPAYAFDLGIYDNLAYIKTLYWIKLFSSEQNFILSN